MAYRCRRSLSLAVFRIVPLDAQRHHPDSPARRAYYTCSSRRDTLAPEKRRNRGKNGNIACMLHISNPLPRAGAPTYSGKISGKTGNYLSAMTRRIDTAKTQQYSRLVPTCSSPEPRIRQHRQEFRQKIGNDSGKALAAQPLPSRGRGRGLGHSLRQRFRQYLRQKRQEREHRELVAIPQFNGT